MNYRHAFFIALGPIVGVSGVQYFFGNLTLLNFLLSLVVCFSGALFMAFISRIGKKPENE